MVRQNGGIRAEYLAAFAACIVALAGALVPSQNTNQEPWTGDIAPAPQLESARPGKASIASAGLPVGVFFVSDSKRLLELTTELPELAKSFPSVQWCLVMSGTAISEATNVSRKLGSDVVILLDRDTSFTKTYFGDPIRFYLVNEKGAVESKSKFREPDLDYDAVRESISRYLTTR